MSHGPGTYFAPLRGERHMSLATFRRSGAAVATPIWFAEVDGRLYVRTASHFGKLKRLARDPRVTVAPCESDGTVTGDALPARGRVVPDGDPVIARANAALDAKYGAERAAMTKLLADQGWQGVYIEIAPPGPPQRA